MSRMTGAMFSEAHVLERLKFYVRASVTEEMIHRTADAEVMFDQMFRQMVMKLHAEIMAEKTGFDEQYLPCEGKVRLDRRDLNQLLVELPQPRWRRWLRLKPRTMWCPVVGNAMCGDGATLAVSGTVKVSADHFHTFPESTMRFPDALGRPHQLIRYDYSTPIWDAP